MSAPPLLCGLDGCFACRRLHGLGVVVGSTNRSRLTRGRTWLKFNEVDKSHEGWNGQAGDEAT